MATRLNAKEAAALTEQRAKALEAQAKQVKQDRQIKAAEAAKLVRLWKTQGNRLIEAALCGETLLRVGPKLIGGNRLMGLGFSLAYIAQSKLLEDQRKIEIAEIHQNETEEQERNARERLRLLELKRLELEASNRIGEFIDLIRKHDRYSGMESSREMVVHHFLEEIENYTAEIYSGWSPDNELFRRLFNSKLFVYKPIDSLRPITQMLQDALHEMERIRRNLPISEAEESETTGLTDDSVALDDDPDNLDEEEVQSSPSVEKYKRYLESWECRDFMEAIDPKDYYQIEWGAVDGPRDWNFDSLIYAPALYWLCGTSGQSLMEAIEAEIQEAIHLASSSIQVSMRGSSKQCTCTVGGKIFHHTPGPSQLSDILKILKYETHENITPEGLSLLEITWQGGQM